MKMNIDEKRTTTGRCKRDNNKDENTSSHHNQHKHHSPAMLLPPPISTSSVLVKTQRDTRIKLRDVNDHLTCFICKGYYIDATTIVECLHSFCRSCIIKRLQFKSYCPVCEMMINKAKPNIKPDKTLQDIVYKLVPGLHRDEMRRRRQFYNNLNQNKTAIQNLTEITPEQRGEDNERVIYNATDPISLSLEYCSTECDLFMTNNNNNNVMINTTTTTKLKNITDYCDDDKQRETTTHDKETNNNTNGNKTHENNNEDGKNMVTTTNENNIPQTRYLQCPAGVSVRLLKKFLIGKFDINIHQYHIDILYKRVPLPDDYKLMDIAYIYSWKRSEPMRIFYRVMDIKYAMNRFDFFNPSIYEHHPHQIIKTTTKSSPLHETTATVRPSTPQDIKAMPPPMLTPTVHHQNGSVVNTLITVKSEPIINVKSEVKSEKSNENIDNVQVKSEVLDCATDENVDVNVPINCQENMPKNVKVKKENCDKIDEKQPSENCDKKQISENKVIPVEKSNNKKSSEKTSTTTTKPCDLSDKQQEALKKVIENAKLTVKKLTENNNNVENKSKLKTCENKQKKTINNNNTPLSAILTATSPPKLFIDDENEHEKSIFLNTFQLTSTKNLSPNYKRPPIINPPALNVQTTLLPPTKHKTSPKKLSPKSSQIPTTSKTLPKQKHQLLTIPNGIKPAAQPEAARTKRKYTFKTRPMGKKARLELERQQQLIAATTTPPQSGSVNSFNKNTNSKPPNNIISNKNVNTKVPPQPQSSLSPRVGEKRKIVSFKLPGATTNHAVPEKRTNYNNSTSKSESNNSLKSLFDNCNLNIPSSLSITLTEGPNDKEMSPQHMATSPIELNNVVPSGPGSRSPGNNGPTNGTNTTTGNFGGKRQSPPVNMYIEIFKIPDKLEQQTPPQPDPKPQNNISPKVPTTVVAKKGQTNGEKVANNVSSSTTKTTTLPTNSTSTPTSAAKQQNIHKVTSLSTTNFVVHTTGIQSLGRKDAAAAALANSSTLSKTPLMPPNGAQLGRKILPKLTPNSSSTTNGNFIPKLAESTKSSTGFQKMFEEAIKRKEQAKAAQTLSKLSGSSSSGASSPSSNQQTINRKKDLVKGHPSQTLSNGGSTEEKGQSNVVLDLSSPSNKKSNMTPRTPPMGGSSPLSALSIQTNQQPPPRLTMKNNKKITTNPQSNLISSTESGSSNSPKSRSGTPLPALSVSVVPNNNTSPVPTTALSPTTIQQQFNLTNLAQLRQVMLLRQQFEIRNHLLQQKQQQTNGNSSSGSPSAPITSSPNGETLMQFENYMKSLQQQAALAAAQQQSATQNKK